MPMINRRRFLTLAASAAGTLLLPRFAWPKGLAAPTEDDPHFYLHLVIPGGADATYLFDARPLALTAAGKLQNYLGQEPTLLTGQNGGTCWASPLVKPLLPYFDRFSVVNGVMMSTSFPGHSQNVNFLFTGSAFGGESFLPQLNHIKPALPLDGVINNFATTDFTNHGGMVPADPATLKIFRDKLAGLPGFHPGSELFDFVHARLAANEGGNGSFSEGAAAMRKALDGTPFLQQKILGVTPPDPSFTPEKQFVSMLQSLFRQGVACTALWELRPEFDTHAAEQAKKQPENFGKVVASLANIFGALRELPFDDQRSLFDVTTVMVSTEFSRTMRQLSATIDNTGTDHNPFTNSFLIGGKGIRGGHVVGASDFQTADEKLSPVHLSLDPNQINIVGRAFDFTTYRPVDDSSAALDPTRYLNVGSVVNTVYEAFGAPTKLHRTLDRQNTVPAPVLRNLLT